MAIAIAIATTAIHHLWSIQGNEPLKSEDIYHVWQEGRRLAEGVNPYARIIGKSLRENDKYPAYLPLSYFFVALLQRLGIKDFSDFIAIWRVLNAFCHVGLGVLIFDLYNRREKPISGIIACSVLLLGRWSAYIIQVQHLEFTAVLAIVAAGHQLQRRPSLSAALFGLSLSIKHLGIILLPCFLIGLHADKQGETAAAESSHWNYGLIALGIPLAISLPFLFDHGTGILLNMAFSATRNFSDHGIATGSRMILFTVDGTRILMAGLIVMNWVAQAREHVNFWVASTMTLLIFLQFNPVIFAQYSIWLASFLLVSLAFLNRARPVASSRP